MDCPICQEVLIVVERKRIELDFCPHCRGWWFDAGELRLLANALQISLDTQDLMQFPAATTSEKSYRCPRCRKKMEKIDIGKEKPLIVDRCVNGEGIWFDAGEVNAYLAQFTSLGESHSEKLLSFLAEAFPADQGRQER